MSEEIILLVEDNPDDAEMALHVLRGHHLQCQIVVREDGPQALEFLFDEAQPLPSLILLDLKLATTSGIEVLERIRGHEPTRFIPVAVLTTSKEPRDVIRSYKSGANSYVVKPIDFDEFRRTLQMIVSYWLSVNQPIE